jgi:hypothetical protein
MWSLSTPLQSATTGHQVLKGDFHPVTGFLDDQPGMRSTIAVIDEQMAVYLLRQGEPGWSSGHSFSSPGDQSMKERIFKTIFRRKPGVSVGLLLVRSCDPTKGCLGILLSNHKSREAALVEQLNHLDAHPQDRTRVVDMIRFMEPGSEIDPRCDLLPIRQEANL